MKYFFTLICLIVFTALAQAQMAGNSQQNTADFGMGIEEQPMKIDKVFPNPVKDVLNIEITTKDSGYITCSLFNILGTEIKKWEPYYVSSGNQKFKLDLTSYKTGVYILKITKDGVQRTQIVKKN
jgi:hypothetical protein